MNYKKYSFVFPNFIKEMADRYQHVSNKRLDLDKDFNEVIRALKSIYPEWNQLATHLDIPNVIIAKINAEYPKPNPFRQMSDLISAWIRRPTPDHHPSWRVLCQALAAMGEVELADQIAGIDQSTSKSAISAATEGVAVSCIAPTMEDLMTQLHNLTNWDLFATHLPEIDQFDVSKISRDYHGIERQKLKLFQDWLDKCPYASWDHVINALEKNKLHKLVANIKQWLRTRGRKARSEPKSPAEIPTKKRRTDHKRIPQANVQPGGLEEPMESTDGNGHLPDGLEDIDWEISSDDTVISPIIIDDHNYVPKGTVTWHSTSQGNTAKGGGNQQRHLVVAFTNEYKGCTRENSRLDEIKKDRRQLYKTFGGKECHLLKSEDSTKQEMRKTLRMTIEVLQQQQNEQYKSVFVIFSGHGGMTKHMIPFIVSEDGKWVNLEKFIRSFEEKIEDYVPKFFLVDACRNVVKRELPKGGAGVNTLHAYATQEGATAGMDEKGSYWIQKVAKLLGSRSSTVVKIIQKANEKVAKKKITQKPIIKVNTLNDVGKNLRLGIDYESSDEEA